MSTGMKRNTLTIEQKLEVLGALRTKNQVTVAKEFNVNQSTISRIRKEEGEIRHEAVLTGNLSRKRKRESPNEKVSEAVIQWFYNMRQQGTVVNGPIMKQKAQQVAETLGCTTFVPTNGWLERFKKRYKIKFIKYAGPIDYSGSEDYFESFVDCGNQPVYNNTFNDNNTTLNEERQPKTNSDDCDNNLIINESCEILRVSYKEAIQALSTVRNYLQQNFSEYSPYFEVEDIIIKNGPPFQRKITDFFKTNLNKSEASDQYANNYT